MIYLNKSSYTMFHTEEACKNYIVQALEDEFLMSELIYNTTSISKNILKLCIALIADDEAEADNFFDELKDKLNGYKEEEIDYCYGEAEDDEEQDLRDEGYVWGD